MILFAVFWLLAIILITVAAWQDMFGWGDTGVVDKLMFAAGICFIAPVVISMLVFIYVSIKGYPFS